MSVTTSTDTLRYTTHAQVLRDYDLHHSSSPSSSAPPPNPHPLPQTQHQNPPSWPTNHRRIPPHRPINTNLDQSQRRVYTSNAERVFLMVMFTGVQTSARTARLWGATGGRIMRDLFRYKIGGEW